MVLIVIINSVNAVCTDDRWFSRCNGGRSAGLTVTQQMASDLKAVTPGNQLCKFADDTYLVIPASNVDSRATEIDNIKTWARTNNLTLNRNKSKEIVFSDPIDEGFRLNHHRQRRILPVSRLSKFSASQ